MSMGSFDDFVQREHEAARKAEAASIDWPACTSMEEEEGRSTTTWPAQAYGAPALFILLQRRSR